MQVRLSIGVDGERDIVRLAEIRWQDDLPLDEICFHHVLVPREVHGSLDCEAGPAVDGRWHIEARAGHILCPSHSSIGIGHPPAVKSVVLLVDICVIHTALVLGGMTYNVLHLSRLQLRVGLLHEGSDAGHVRSRH